MKISARPCWHLDGDTEMGGNFVLMVPLSAPRMYIFLSTVTRLLCIWRGSEWSAAFVPGVLAIEARLTFRLTPTGVYRSSVQQSSVSPQGLYAFKKMSFGLFNSGATFCRLMWILLKGLDDDNLSLVLKKNGLRGFRPGPTQTGLYSHRRWLEA